jgi:hypothetical protein
MTNICRSRDPEEPAKGTEFSWGPGLVPRGYEFLPPSQGGMYRGTCEPVERTWSPDLSVRVRPAKHRPGDPPHGYPGERVG